MTAFNTPSGRTSLFAISRPRQDQAWRDPRKVIELLHCFGKITASPPKHHYTKGAGDTEYIGRVNGALDADIELNGDFGFSGMRSLLLMLFGPSLNVSDVVEADKVWSSLHTLPITPITIGTIAHYDGVGRLTEVPSWMATSLQITGKHDGVLAWQLKGMGDMVRQNEHCFNTVEDVLAAVYASDVYFQKYASHDASADSQIGSLVGFTRASRAGTSVPALSTLNEFPWSDFKLSIDLKAIGINSQRRTKNFPAINDLPEVKYEFSIPTESRNVDDQGVWADFINQSFEEGGNRGVTPVMPVDYKLAMQFIGPLAGGSLINPFMLNFSSPRLAARCSNPVAASAGLEPIKIEFTGMRAKETDPDMPGVRPVYISYQTDHTAPAAAVQYDPPLMSTPIETDATDYSEAYGAPDDTPCHMWVDGILLATGSVQSNQYEFSSLDFSAEAGKSVTVTIGVGEEASDPTETPVVVTHVAPVITGPVDNTDTVVSGTASIADNGATVYLYRGGSTLLGSATISAGAWTVGSLVLTLGWVLTAKVGTGDAESAASAPVTVT